MELCNTLKKIPTDPLEKVKPFPRKMGKQFQQTIPKRKDTEANDNRF